VRSAPGAASSARRGEGSGGEFGGFAGCELQIWGGVGRTGLLAWLEWRRRAATGGRGREDEVEEREREREREREEEEWEMGKEILATSFLVLLGAVLPFRPPRFARFLKWSPAWASCWAAGVLAVACRMTLP
jgi:hypothetical protein